MAWHRDEQRNIETEQARSVKAQLTEGRMKTARRMYEGGATVKEICQRARCDDRTLKEWVRAGGWRRES